MLCGHARYLQRQEKDVRSPETEVKDSCEGPCGCWKSNSNPLEVQPVLFSAQKISFFINLFVCVHGGVQRDMWKGHAHVCHGALIDVRGHFSRARSVFPPHAS